jgi:hypothetical protein
MTMDSKQTTPAYTLVAKITPGEVENLRKELAGAAGGDTKFGSEMQGNFHRVLKYTEGWPGSNNRDAFVAFWRNHELEEGLNTRITPALPPRKSGKHCGCRRHSKACSTSPVPLLKHPALKALLAEATDLGCGAWSRM